MVRFLGIAFVLGFAAVLGFSAPATADLITDLENHYSFDRPDLPGRDLSGNGRHGTVSGADWVLDNDRGAVMEYVETQNDVITAALSGIDGSGFTFSMWTKWDNPGSTGNLGLFTAFDSAQAGNKTIGGWVDKAQDEIWGRLRAGGNKTPSPRTALAEDQWTHLAFRADGSEYKLFKDGQPTNTAVSYSGSLDEVVDQLRIGRQGSESWNGRLDDFRVYSRALTDQEIVDLHALDTTGRGYAHRVAFDFDGRYNGSGDLGPTQDDFTKIGIASNNSTINPATMHGVTLEITSAWNGHRNRYDTGVLSGHPLAAVLQDFVFDNDFGDPFELELSGLAPEQRYELTIFSYDRTANSGRSSDWYQDAIAGSPLYTHTLVSGDPDSGYFSLMLRSDSDGMIHLLAESDSIVIFNGLELLQVPEPATVSLLLVGMLGLLLGRRRRG